MKHFQPDVQINTANCKLQKDSHQTVFPRRRLALVQTTGWRTETTCHRNSIKLTHTHLSHRSSLIHDDHKKLSFSVSMAIFSRWTWVSQFQNVSILDFTGIMELCCQVCLTPKHYKHLQGWAVCSSARHRCCSLLKENNSVIFSDSMSSLQAISGFKIELSYPNVYDGLFHALTEC